MPIPIKHELFFIQHKRHCESPTPGNPSPKSSQHRIAVVKDIDLKAEHEKATVALELINDALIKQKAVKDEDQSLLKARRDIADLKVKQSALTKALSRSCHQEGKVAEEEHLDGDLTFRGDDDSDSETGDDNNLEERERLMRENLDLLVQRKNIKKFSAKIKENQTDLGQVVQLLSVAESVFSTVEPKAHAFALALEKLSCALHSPELFVAQDAVKSQAALIASLKKTDEMQTKMIQVLNSGLVGMEIVNRRQQLLIAPLVTHLVALQSLEEDKNKTVAENMKAAYEEGRKSQYREMAGPYEAGCAIGARKLVWLSDMPDELNSGLGNKAAHYGMALVDATMYQPTCPAPYRRTNTADFIKFYGVIPEFVCQHQLAGKLLEILDWRDIVMVLEHPSTVKVIAELKDFYEAGLQRHNAYLKDRSHTNNNNTITTHDGTTTTTNSPEKIAPMKDEDFVDNQPDAEASGAELYRMFQEEHRNMGGYPGRFNPGSQLSPTSQSFDFTPGMNSFGQYVYGPSEFQYPTSSLPALGRQRFGRQAVQ
ncbi:hypothetical protein BKA65DRAFT_474011 [Rhexocercosporidium sp. MPI-PUGE-AT-0058]|nr:hypothetical protein BKA65DRAFT_474011 [Rhexocercosporidium sp. MPI-PUGE-AT-0058]